MRSEVRRLVLETAKRFPGQEIPKDSLNAAIDDWLVLADEVGLKRFEDGVKLTWQYCEFFPKPKNIRQLVPPPKLKDGEVQNRELRELQRRKDAGEKFYSLADVFKGFCRNVESGKIRGRDERGQKALQSWAKTFAGSEEALAKRMLEAEDTKPRKSDFQSAHEMLLKQKEQLLSSSAQAERS